MKKEYSPPICRFIFCHDCKLLIGSGGNSMPVDVGEDSIESPLGRWDQDDEDSAESPLGRWDQDDEVSQRPPTTFAPIVNHSNNPWRAIRKYVSNLFNNRHTLNEVYGSIYTSAEVRRGFHMLVQIYLHLPKETEMIKALAQESQKDAERRDYIPLQCKLKKGDKVDILLNIYGENLLFSAKKSVAWQGTFTKCSFDYYVPKDIEVCELSSMALLTVNSIPIGEMSFLTKIVDAPRRLNPEIMAHRYCKVFISYAHQDESNVKFLAEGFRIQKTDYFFDRHYLKAGDVFPQKIQEYIDTADLFILCWSENASKSEYIEKERTQALKRAFPAIRPPQAAKLSIYPMSIEPRTELPIDMREDYHFGEL